GALASISVDYDLLASSTGNTVSNVILGVKADDIPIQRFPTSVITLNQKTADKIEFTFPQSILNKAKHIIE
ncbi:MAG: ABC transporter substrate binding protein, partial [Candidatus Kapaibacterium sp.]